MIVVDTNVIAYLFFDGPYQKEARALFKNDPIWMAPILWRSEFRNVLATYLRQKLINLNTAIQILQKAEEIFQGNEFQVKSDQVMKLVNQSSCSAYDCEFIALAQYLEVDFYTSDKKLISAFPHCAIPLSKVE